MPKQCRNDAKKEGAEVGTKDGAEVFGTTAAFPGRASLRPDCRPSVYSVFSFPGAHGRRLVIGEREDWTRSF